MVRLFTFLALSTLAIVCYGHPQCLDYRAPFYGESTLGFCSDYSDFGCCTNENEKELKTEYFNIKKQVSNDTWKVCGKYVRELLCQKCSPYAAHIYDAEGKPKARSFPGLCNDYCRTFYRYCRNIIQYLTEDKELLRQVQYGTTAFCNHIQLVDKDYCFPDLKSNPVLNRNISILQITKEGCLCLEPFAQNLKNPVFARHPGDDSGRLIVGQVSGEIFVYYLNGTREKEPFLDIRHNTLNTINTGDERGLLGIAFHPKFAQNRRFFIFYSTYIENSDLSSAANHKIRLSEFVVRVDNKNKADLQSERIVLEILQPFWNHNGGEILFGDDGYLYMFVGDGGAGGDPLGNSQNTNTLLGKVLRLNVDNTNVSYTIPADNPFVGINNFRPEIYAYGVRNIWRCGKDRGDPLTGEGKGRVICGDVGQSAFEELDLLKKGVNYGWNGKEGFSCYDVDACNMIDGTDELPIHAYPHSVGKSVTGGHFYRGCLSPNLNGYYIYGDFMSGKMFRLIQNSKTKEWQNKEINMCGSDMCVPPLVNSYPISIISFGEDEHGEIYMMSTSNASSAAPFGQIFRIVDPFRRGNPSTCKSADHHTFSRIPITKSRPNKNNASSSNGSQDSSKKVPSNTNTSNGAQSVRRQGRKWNRRRRTKHRRRQRNRRRRLKMRKVKSKKHSLKLEGIRFKFCRKKPNNLVCKMRKFYHE